jgi:hypothetical protein
MGLKVFLFGKGTQPEQGKGRDQLEMPEAVERVRRQRTQSATLPVLRARLRTRFSGARCIIIGSAPNLVAPPRRPGDCCLCANGSVQAALALGISEPDLTVITGHATNLSNAVSRANVKAWQGRQTSELVFIVNGDTEAHAQQLFADTGFGYRHFTALDIYERAVIIEDVTGIDAGVGARDDRISMGVFAAVLAMWGGAAEIVLCGLSLQGGHSYIASSTPRHHVAGDSRFFECLPNLPVRVSTTSLELQQRFGLRPSA